MDRITPHDAGRALMGPSQDLRIFEKSDRGPKSSCYWKFPERATNTLSKGVPKHPKTNLQKGLEHKG